MPNLIQLFILLVLTLGTVTQAQNLRFDQVTQSDFDAITREFSGNFAHSTVSGASTLGEIFGFEIALIGTYTKTPEIERFVKRVDSSQSVANLYNAVLSGQLTVPFGLTAEASFFPAIGSDTYKFSNLALGLKWTMTQDLLELPLDIALKLNYTSTNLSFKQTINNSSTGNVPVESTLNLKNGILAYGVFVSKTLAMIEPYIGFCYLSTRADLSVSGAGTIFDSSFTSGQSASSSPTGTLLTVGADLTLGFAKIGAEYASVYGTSRYLAKLGVSF